MSFISAIALTITIFVGVCGSAPNCAQIVAPDGGTYDLTALQNKIFEFAVGERANTPGVINISICSNMPLPCGDCNTSYSAASCKTFNGSGSLECLGKYDNTSVIKGLNQGQGIYLYYGGLQYSVFSTALYLLCDSNVPVKEIVFNATNYNTPQGKVPFYGTINCTVSNVPTIAKVSYYGYDPNCNGTNAQMIVVNMTHSCTEGCHKENNQYVYVTCDRGVQHLKGTRWIETVHFEDDQCSKPTSQVFRKADQCNGNFSYYYETCDQSGVSVYNCNFNPNCQGCKLTNKLDLNKCYNGTVYDCAYTLQLSLTSHDNNKE